jgi:hypothetical protein
MYREMFNSFIAPHELGHYLQDVAGRWKRMSGWDAELEANRIGIAFWSLQPGPEGRVDARVENITRFLDEVPSPVPAGDTAQAFFNCNYAAFTRGEAGPLNAMNYSWFQALMFTTALRERRDHSFCRLVALKSTVPGARSRALTRSTKLPQRSFDSVLRLRLIQSPRYRLHHQIDAGELVPVLLYNSPPPTPISLLHPGHRNISPRTRVFAAWLAALFERFQAEGRVAVKA